jgi:peptidoglycan glycosyltransferase
VNTPISRLFAVALVMFAALVGATTWWTVVRADDLNHDHPDQNRRGQVRGLTVKRGAIRADDNLVLAGSIKRGDGTYTRRYPQGALFAHVVGYSFLTASQTGLEAEYDDDLRGKRSDAQTIVDELRGVSSDGDRLLTHLDPTAQRVALQALAGRRGSVVALDPRTGAVKVMASLPGYDPNAVRKRDTFRRLQAEPTSPLFNRATQGGYPPGSTFKVVTAIAAIDSGKYEPGSQIDGKSPITVSGAPLANDGGESFGMVDFTKALTLSINTVFAQVGEAVGARTMKRYMDRLGFCKTLPLDLPEQQIRPSGEYVKGRCVSATNGAVDVGRMAIGQDKLQVSPLQMAMVAAAVANGGKLMEPRIADRVVDPDGRTRRTIDPEEYSRVMSSGTAQKVTEMMSKVVQEGTGTAAALEGFSVAGKTGTAEIGAIASQDLTQPWFIAFAPVEDPKVAIAVTIERTVGGFGGTVAAPIAKDVMQTLLREEGK